MLAAVLIGMLLLLVSEGSEEERASSSCVSREQQLHPVRLDM